ncbi:hypothetical protein ACFQY8_06665 [Alloscardovia venturai]|uniref:Uncharacterized protein n=1 Tax=Alloscardovia venturai TaxID=1769421 RepID=A0ABW2Y829_9BIFI
MKNLIRKHKSLLIWLAGIIVTLGVLASIIVAVASSTPSHTEILQNQWNLYLPKNAQIVEYKHGKSFSGDGYTYAKISLKNSPACAKNWTAFDTSTLNKKGEPLPENIRNFITTAAKDAKFSIDFLNHPDPRFKRDKQESDTKVLIYDGDDDVYYFIAFHV